MTNTPKLALTTVVLHGNFPVGSIVKAIPVLPSQPYFCGVVITNDGVDFEVQWDFSRVVTKFNIAAETKSAELRLAEMQRWIAELTKEHYHGTSMDGLAAGAYARGDVRRVLERVAPPAGVA